MQVPEEARRGCSPIPGVIGSCEPDIGSGTELGSSARAEQCALLTVEPVF